MGRKQEYISVSRENYEIIENILAALKFPVF